jgi:hypothetical protein
LFCEKTSDYGKLVYVAILGVIRRALPVNELVGSLKMTEFYVNIFRVLQAKPWSLTL